MPNTAVLISWLKEVPLGTTLLGISYGGWTTGNITDEMVQEYLEHHRDPSKKVTGKMILE